MISALLQPSAPEEAELRQFADAVHRRSAECHGSWRACDIREVAPGRMVVDDTHQPIGAFKLRGAAAAVRALAVGNGSPGGVVVASSGSFGMAVATVCRELGVDARVNMPFDTPDAKRSKIEKAGADVDASWPSYEAAKLAARDLAATGERVFIDGVGPDVFAGNGSLAREVVESGALTGGRTAVVVPLGIGSLAVPMGLYLRAAGHAHDLYVVEPLSHCKFLARHTHGIRPEQGPTLADGAAVAEVPDVSLRVLDRIVRGAIAVSEAETEDAIRHLWHEHGIRAEGAGALSTAALLAAGDLLDGYDQVWTFITGANIRDERFDEIVAGSTAPT